MLGLKTVAGEGLHIIIVGCGKVGSALTEQLSKEGHDITVVDQDVSKVAELTNLYDVMGITGNGASYNVQMEAGIENCDLIIAVTDSDELNLLCCTVAKKAGDCAAVARVRTPDYSRDITYLREKLGLTMIINPDLEAARETARILYLPTALEVNSFAHGQTEMVKFKLPAGNILVGKSVMELGRDICSDILICVIQRGDEIYIPDGSFVMEEGDIISFVASRSHIRGFLKNIGFKTKQVKNTMIVGGGKSAYYLAENLINMGIDVKLIEKDRKRCDELSILLPKAIIINGDGTDQELLMEEGIERAESFVPLTGIDEENIMLNLFAKQVSEAKVITKINRMTFKNVIGKLDLGSVIYPRIITSEALIAYVRAKNNSQNSNIETLYHMFDSRVEAIEVRVDEASAVTSKTLSELRLKKNLLVCSIYRRGKVIIPSGQDQINLGDTVIVVTTHKRFNDIKDILEK